MRIESGELRRAAEVADELTSQAQQHGLDSWSDVGAAQVATVAALAAVEKEPADSAALQAHSPASLRSSTNGGRARSTR